MWAKQSKLAGIMVGRHHPPLESKEVKKRGMGLHTLWEDNEEVPITLPRLMRQQEERQQRSFLTVGVVEKARKEIGWANLVGTGSFCQE